MSQRHVLGAAVLTAGLLVPMARIRAQEPVPAPAGYRVHEWGTFTSMVGTDGAVLEGLHREEASLPPFVHDLLKVDEAERLDEKIPASRVTQKMETPVLYFHADEPLRVRVGVWFDRGLMTQFYPLPDVVRPALPLLQHQRVDMSKVGGSMLEWDIDVLPRHTTRPREIPAVAADDPWALARQVDAAYVRTRCAGGVAPEAEHYLFYRGLGRWQPALRLELDGPTAVELTNGTRGAIPFVAVLELDAQGGRFVVGSPLAAGASARLSWADQVVATDRRLLAGKLGDHVHKALERTGLFADEARAMVATWSRSWFQQDGARVIWLLPRAEVDAVLPLQLSPPPLQTVRALVGRLEFITSSAQRGVEAALRGAAAADTEQVARAAAHFAALDRFLEPHLRNVASNGSDAEVRGLAARRLALLAP